MPQNKSLKDILESSKILSTFLILSFLYLPLYVLFIGGGTYSKVLLAIITGILYIFAFLVLGRFSYFLADFLNSKTSKFGDLWIKYTHHVIPSLVVLKILGYAVFRMLPRKHEGILCDLVRFVKDLFYILRYQEVLNYLIVGSFLAIVLVFTIRLIRR